MQELKPRKRTRNPATTAAADHAFELRAADASGRELAPLVHVYGNHVVCSTDKRGQSTPRGRSPLEIVVDASEGFIPLWAAQTTLRWRFQDRSLQLFANPTAARTAIRKLFGEALLAWGDATPVRFAERDSRWDFEVVVRRNDDCDVNGCVLASAFFPDGGQHELVLYPKLFAQPRSEQIETLAHELGHVFGLRHFFAQISESAWPSEVFGAHRAFSIMNYGPKSRLTKEDRSDLKRLYTASRNGSLTQINGTPIRLVRPFSAVADAAVATV